MKHFSASFFLAVLWTTPGIPLTGGKKKMAGVTANGISRMRFGIFSFMRPARCYLAVEQRNLGCHFARHQQRPRADSVSRVRSQVQKEISTGGGWVGEGGGFMVMWHHGRKLQSNIQTDPH